MWTIVDDRKTGLLEVPISLIAQKIEQTNANTTDI